MVHGKAASLRELAHANLLPKSYRRCSFISDCAGQTDVNGISCFIRILNFSLSLNILKFSDLEAMIIFKLSLFIQFIGNFKVTQYFVTIVRPHFQCLEFHIKAHGTAGKQCSFSAQKAGKRSLFFRKFGWKFNLNSVDTLDTLAT